MSEQASRSQDEVPTLSELKAAAQAVPSKPIPHAYYPDNLAELSQAWANHERARADFWRLAYQWERHRSPYAALPVVDEADKIIAKVEART